MMFGSTDGGAWNAKHIYSYARKRPFIQRLFELCLKKCECHLLAGLN